MTYLTELVEDVIDAQQAANEAQRILAERRVALADRLRDLEIIVHHDADPQRVLVGGRYLVTVYDNTSALQRPRIDVESFTTDVELENAL